jgi:hypothetical protein
MSMISIFTVISDDEIQQLHDSPERIDDFTSDKRTTTDLDKAWQGIHWLLTGSEFCTDEPLCYLVAGGQEVSFADFGYGPPRTLTSSQIAAWDDALSKISPEELGRRFDAKAMLAAKIYPQIWIEPDSLNYLLDSYRRLKDFVAASRKTQSGLLIYLS